MDTGAAVSIISDAPRKAMFPALKIYRSNLLLQTYTEEQIPLVGNIHVHEKYSSQEAKLVLVVIQGDGPTLLGRNWLKYIKLDWNKIAVIHSTKPELWKVLSQKHEALFQDDLGTVSSYQATLNLKPDATPIFFKPRPVPFAIKEAIGQELDRMGKLGVIERINYSEWTAPIVAVPRRMDIFAFVVTSKSPLTNV